MTSHKAKDMNKRAFVPLDRNCQVPDQNIGQKSCELEVAFEEDEAPFLWRNFGLEDGLTLLVFWSMAGVVFAQFFSRYILSSSLGWTEEVARYLLICVGFMAATIGIRKRSHIRLELLYRYLPVKASAVIIWLMDIGQLVYFAMLGWVTWKILPLMSAQKMTSIAISMEALYSIVLFSIAIMVIRLAGQVIMCRGPKDWLRTHASTEK
ncbi:TRAP transporter small permease [Cobetia amphilecti]|uniref:TRAP transporter small permease n=1 Tax=Cobetia amphilecti TaxID=1055104 RepID=UPI0006947627|nr:TRAP transporter small permease [Cobetia amphilecti]